MASIGERPGRATILARGTEHQVRAVELDSEQRVAFFRDTLEPIVRRMPGRAARY